MKRESPDPNMTIMEEISGAVVPLHNSALDNPALIQRVGALSRSTKTFTMSLSH